MKNEKNDWSVVAKIFGWLLALATTLKKLASEKRVPFEAFLRLTTEKGETTLRAIVQLVLDDYNASLPKPPAMQGGAHYRDAAALALEPGHYLIRVDRGPLPSKTKLEEEFSKDGVSDLYTDKYEWKKDRCRTGANDLTDETVEVLVKEFSDDEIREMGGELDSDRIIQWGLSHGWLPADEKESHAVGIDPQTRDLQMKNPLVALGSFAVRDDCRYVSVLGSDGGQRLFYYSWFDDRWNRDYRFLFVRKASR